MAKIEFEDKTSLRNSDIPEVNKLTAANINEIKASVNNLYDNPVFGYTVTEVDLDISELGEGGVQIKEAAGAGKYYEGFVLAEVTPGTPWSYEEGDFIVITDGLNQVLPSNILDSVDQFIYKSGHFVYNFELESGITVNASLINQPIIIRMNSNIAPTDGTTTVKLKIYTQTLTFG